MAHAAFHLWTGAPSAPQPARSLSGLVIAWDGRLDNRHDLLLRLGPLAGDGAGDAALAAAAFERWGSDGLRALVGDWSLAIWDGAARTLHLARDYMGVRPLYYSADEQAGAVVEQPRGHRAPRRSRRRAQRRVRRRVHAPCGLQAI